MYRCPSRGLAAALCVVALGAAAQAPRPRAESIGDGAYVVQGLSAARSAANRGFISNAAFFVTPEGVVVVDALGSPAVAREMLEEIRRVTRAPLRYLVLTHFHADHLYGAQVFKDAGAVVVAHSAGRAYLASDAAAAWLQASRSELAPAVDADTRLVAADWWIDAPATLRLGGREFVLQPVAPAHTDSDLVVWAPQARVLVAGDTVFRGRLPFVGQGDSARWIDALDALLAYDARVVVPGHGPLATEPRADLQLTRDYLVHLRRTMGAAARELEPFDEAYARTDWSRFAQVPMFELTNRANAYNTYLLMEHDR